MDEKSGQIIHNAVLNQFHLSITAKFRILKKNFLEFSGKALGSNDTSRRDMLINIIGFVPLGYFLFLVFNSYSQPLKTSAWRLIIPAILGGIIVSLIIETLQAWLPTRHSSATDLIFNTFGTGLGIILAVLFVRLKTRFQRTSFSESQ